VNRKSIVIAFSAAALVVTPAANATIIKTGGSTGLQLLATKIANAYKGAKVTVVGGGSGAGISGAASGKFDIGNSSRAPGGSDNKALRFYPIAKEPFVVIVNPKNKNKSLTEAQIKGIFTGTITNWSQVGWAAGGAIKVYSRVATSGTLSTFRNLYLGGAAVTSSAKQLSSNGLDKSSVSNDKSGISFVTYAYTLGTKKIRGLKVGGIAPTLVNVRNGSFKYAGKQYFVTKGAPTGAVETYINWVRSAAGAKIIAKYALPNTDAFETP
jgi:phosphate transport system substrate-binding protein